MSQSNSSNRLNKILNQLNPISTSDKQYINVLNPNNVSGISGVIKNPPPSIEIVPKPLPNNNNNNNNKANEAASASGLYSSRQLSAFTNQDSSKVEQINTGIKISPIELYHAPNLSEWFSDLPKIENSFVRSKHNKEILFNHPREIVLMDIVRREGIKTEAKAFTRAGPRRHIVWRQGEVKAAIVTCGGLCPGLNDVIAEIFSTLYYNYGVDTVYGIRMGFRGFYEPQFLPYLNLDPEQTMAIYQQGGSILASSRGGFDLNKIMEACSKHGINQLYIIGGDGTHRAADKIHHEAKKRKIKMTVAGIPKTIDNDIGVIDRSFGFNTAVAEARRAIQTAQVEARCAPFGVGIVQLMGRHAGYIAAHATLAARNVDMCLIPEVQFPLHGELGVLNLASEVLDRQGYCVIVVAEGAGADLLASSSKTDESGNKKLADIGRFLAAELGNYLKNVKKHEANIKFIDPSYMIRAVPCDASDSVYCQYIAHNAVHGAMAGYTGFTSGLVNNRTVLIPFDLISKTSPSYLNPDGRTWERVCSLTHQPKWKPMPTNFKPDVPK